MKQYTIIVPYGGMFHRHTFFVSSRSTLNAKCIDCGIALVDALQEGSKPDIKERTA